MNASPEYALATIVPGGSEIRVRVVCREDDRVFVITASLGDVGTRLVLDALRVRPEPGPVVETLSHGRGLVTFG